MTETLDLGVFVSDGETEKQLGDGVVDDLFADHASVQLQWKYDSKWGKSGDPSSPNATKIHEIIKRGDSNETRDTGLELRRCARNYLKPMELVYRNPSNKKETLLAVVETIPTKDSSSGTINTSIYSPEPSFLGQVPTNGKSSALAINGVLPTLYPWATVKKKSKKRSNYFEYFTDIEMVKGRNKIGIDRPLSIEYASEEVPGPTGPQTIVRKQERRTNKEVSPSENITASMTYSKDKSLSMVIPRGIDPCLIICLASDMLNRKIISDAKSQQDACLVGCCFCLG